MREMLFDEVRREWVKATPEEKVRQTWLYRLVYSLNYPKELLVVEKELKDLPHLSSKIQPKRRVDILCYGRFIHPEHSLYPLLLIECKREEIGNTAVEQLIGYNGSIHAYFIAVANHKEIRLGYFHKQKKTYVFESGLPSYQELVGWIKQ